MKREERVAFIGISNWALDPAKMNRGVMVTRGELGLDELHLSARGICSTEDKDPVREKLERYFDPLSRAYMEICMKQERQFFGLRDFYRCVCICVCARMPVCIRVCMHAFERFTYSVWVWGQSFAKLHYL